MAKIENLSTLENSSSNVSVTLCENHLKKDGSYYARVSRNTASFKTSFPRLQRKTRDWIPIFCSTQRF